MHVVQLLPELNQGGVERGTVELSRELVRRGHRSTVISAGGKLAAHIERDGGRHIALDLCSKNPLTVPLRVRKLRRILRSLMQQPIGNRQSTIDNAIILHARSRVPAWLCRFANKKLHAPFVTTVHGFNSVSRYSRIMTRGDAVICVSNPVKEYILKHYKTPEEKITVIHRGVDPAEFDPARLDGAWMESFKQKHGLDGQFIVGAVGRVTELKDYETFIRAVASCAETKPLVRGLIVGGVRQDKQGYCARLQALVRELRAEERIVFAGSQDRLPEIYSLCDLLVSCSKRPEAFGRTLVEALAMNTPVVAARHGGALDIVVEGVNGAFFAPGDAAALARLIAEPPQLGTDDLRRDALRRFSLSAMAEKTLALYGFLLHTRQ